jgi:hypothetical protein
MDLRSKEKRQEAVTDKRGQGCTRLELGYGRIVFGFEAENEARR